MEMITVILMAFLRNEVSPGDSDLYNAFETGNSSDSCARTSRAVGEMFHYILSVETPDEVYYEALTFSLAELEWNQAMR